MRLTLAALVALTLLPAVASAQQPSLEGLQRQVDSLRARTAELEFRLNTLVTYLQAEPWKSGASATVTSSPDLGKWRRLKRGMSMDQVRSLLGEPESVAAGSFTFWYYSDHASVSFYQEKLDGWQEPVLSP